MSYCPKCGKEVKENSAFCGNCGNSLNVNSNIGFIPNEQRNNFTPPPQKSNSSSNVILGIGGALAIVGFISEFIVMIFITSKGKEFGYDTWNYYYTGGREMAMLLAFLAGLAFFVGLFMVIFSGNGNKK